MEFLELAKKRYSVRSYTDKKVEKEKLDKILEAAHVAPTAADIDASILTDHMMMEATELGLGSVWICFFKLDVIRQEFNLPEDLEPINILAVGYSDEEAASPERHSSQRISVDELVSYV